MSAVERVSEESLPPANLPLEPAGASNASGDPPHQQLTIGDHAGTSSIATAPGVRHRIEHIETLTDEDLPRFAREGIVASMQAIHLENMHADRSDPWSRALRSDRCDRAFRMRDLIDSGARLALGSDWPVARFDPGRGMAWARLRREPGERDALPYNGDQVLTPREALEGYTSGAAYTVGDERVSGRIARGFRADLTALTHDPVEVSADDLIDLPVALTIVDGEIVYRAS